MRHFKEPARGYCPYLERDHTIFIESAEILLAGGQPSKERRLGYSCEFRGECEKEYKKPCPIACESEDE